MDWDVINRLKHYGRQTEKKDVVEKGSGMVVHMQNKNCVGMAGGLDIENIAEGDIYQDEDGRCFIIENRYPLSYLYGGCCLGDVLNINSRSLRRLCPDIGDAETLRNFLFLDVETTGLSGGVGTVAFLVGTGFFENDSFVVRQHFMRDYDEEIAMLNALNMLIQSYNGLVTFNGKAFDWNIIRTRYTYNRIRLKFTEEDTKHIDLLLLSRRIWKGKLESCALSSLEENILGEFRTDDIPGALIPQVYFKYVIDRDAREIKRVMKHNELDILSMVSLLYKINNMLEDPLSEADCGHELIGLGKMLESIGEYDAVVDCFEKCMELEDPLVKDIALKKLSQIYKREGNYKEAVKHWENMMHNQDFFSIFSLVELAKYHEHRSKNIAKAIEMTEKAIQLSLKMGIINNIYRFELKKRLERLKRKAGNMKDA
ncbi:MAG: ribonuclease H-like domain-containing protein [Firmicutes bacterium]|nr:ribonuclease H-like domain-containing protein [Bacillota bacterium]